MRASDIETWALGIVERVEKGQPVEDARVELKRDWPLEPIDMARRIAGHANAARGEPILWLIGVDQKGGQITGAPGRELADWWPQVRSRFDGLAPHLVRDLAVPYDGKTVVALLFETDRAPFVVTTKGGPATHEVPWREATGIRSARRDELLRILVPAAKLPTYELLGVRFQSVTQGYTSKGTIEVGRFEVDLYFIASPDTCLFVPFHRCKGEFGLAEEPTSNTALSAIRLFPPSNHLGQSISTTMQASMSELRIQGPGRVIVYADCTYSAIQYVRSRLESPLAIMLSIPVLELDQSIEMNASLKAVPPREGYLAEWMP